MRLRVTRTLNPHRPWCVRVGPVVIDTFRTWREAIRYATGTTNHMDGRGE